MQPLLNSALTNTLSNPQLFANGAFPLNLLSGLLGQQQQQQQMFQQQIFQQQQSPQQQQLPFTLMGSTNLPRVHVQAFGFTPQTGFSPIGFPNVPNPTPPTQQTHTTTQTQTTIPTQNTTQTTTTPPNSVDNLAALILSQMFSQYPPRS